MNPFIGEEGEIFGDVCAAELAISPGGSIQGVVRCGEKPEAKVPDPPFDSVAIPDDTMTQASVERKYDVATLNNDIDEPLVPEVFEGEKIYNGAPEPSYVGETATDIFEGENKHDEVAEPSSIGESVPEIFEEESKHTEIAESSYIGELVPDVFQEENKYIEADVEPRFVVGEGEGENKHQVNGEQVEYTGERVSEKSKARSSTRQNLLVDDFGNPLFRVPTEDDVESLRRNRDLVQQTRELLDSANKRPKSLPGLPDWSAPINSPADNVWREERSQTQDDDDETDLPGFLR